MDHPDWCLHTRCAPWWELLFGPCSFSGYTEGNSYRSIKIHNSGDILRWLARVSQGCLPSSSSKPCISSRVSDWFIWFYWFHISVCPTYSWICKKTPNKSKVLPWSSALKHQRRAWVEWPGPASEAEWEAHFPILTLWVGLLSSFLISSSPTVKAPTSQQKIHSPPRCSKTRTFNPLTSASQVLKL